MAHFSSKSCDTENATCCCSGRIVFNAFRCSVEYFSSDAVYGQIRKDGDPEVLIDDTLVGEFYVIDPGTYQFWIKCMEDGRLFLAGQVEVTAEDLTGCEVPPQPTCFDFLREMGFNALSITVNAQGAPYSFGNFTEVRTLNSIEADEDWQGGCSFCSQRTRQGEIPGGSFSYCGIDCDYTWEHRVTTGCVYAGVVNVGTPLAPRYVPFVEGWAEVSSNMKRTCSPSNSNSCCGFTFCSLGAGSELRAGFDTRIPGLLTRSNTEYFGEFFTRPSGWRTGCLSNTEVLGARSNIVEPPDGPLVCIPLPTSITLTVRLLR